MCCHVWSCMVLCGQVYLYIVMYGHGHVLSCMGLKVIERRSCVNSYEFVCLTQLCTIRACYVEEPVSGLYNFVFCSACRLLIAAGESGLCCENCHHVAEPVPELYNLVFCPACKPLIAAKTATTSNTTTTSGKKIKNKTKNDLLAMKQILYDMGPLTLVRWPL